MLNILFMNQKAPTGSNAVLSVEKIRRFHKALNPHRHGISEKRDKIVLKAQKNVAKMLL